MAARLTVILSQSARRDSQATDAEESVLADLMMTSGLQATLVGALENISIESTDCMCLSSFAQDVALVTWLPEDEADRHWRRLNLPGRLISVASAAGDSRSSSSGQLGTVQANGSRRVYYFSMSLGSPAILAGLQRVLEEKSIKTVSLILPVAPTVRSVEKASPAKSTGPDKSHGAAATSASPPARAAAKKPKEPLPATARPVNQPAEVRGAADLSDDEAEWSQLDQLVDDFDALDL